MDDLSALNAKVEQLQLIVDSMVQEMTIGAAGGNNGAAGPGNFAIPVLGDDGTEKPGLFEVESLGRDSISMRNRYYRIGGKTFEAGDNAPRGEGILCLSIDITRTLPQPSYEIFETVEDMQDEEKDKDKYIVPLYTFDANGEVTVDWRKGPNMAMGEF